MRKLACILSVAALCAATTVAATDSYGWEDGVGTILGSYGNLVDPTNVSGPQQGQAGSEPDFTCPGPNSGERYLHVAEEPQYSTPQAYIAWIIGLADGDTIDASFFGYDVTAGSSPSLRIWGHYTTSDDIENFQGSASGSDLYTTGIGWEQLSHTWTFDSDGGARDALVVEARLYSTPSTGENRTDYFIDDVSVTAPDGATIIFAPEPSSLLLLGLGLVGLLRRR